MTLAGLTVRQWLRSPVDVAAFATCAALGVANSWLSGEARGALPFLAPLVAAYLAAGDTAQSLRLGRYDLLVSRGPQLGLWVSARVVLSALGGLVVLLSHLAVPALQGSYAPGKLVAWALVVVYWAALGGLLGLRLSGAGVVVLMLASMGLGVWWVWKGFASTFGTPPQEAGTFVPNLLAWGLLVPVPFQEMPIPGSPPPPWWSVLHALGALAAWGGSWLGSQRRQLAGREEG